jgi:L-cysteine S-thiosulfotransferase
MKSRALLFTLYLMMLTGCDPNIQAARGFSLPEGNIESGEQLYVRFQCNACHRIAGIEQLLDSEDSDISVQLGGEVLHLKTYGELVTSIINPSHRIAQSYAPQNTGAEGQSNMYNYNDVMTISQLIDLVSFLESRYELAPYRPSQYGLYYP